MELRKNGYMTIITCNNKKINLIRSEIAEPKKCVICGTKTQRRLSSDGKTLGATIECTNDVCPAKVLGKIKNFVGKVEILGLGDTIIEALVNNGLVKSIPDLYNLTESALSQVVAGNQVGEARAKEIVKEINKKRSMSIDLLLGSIGINHLGRRRVEIIRKNIFSKTGNKFDTIDAWLSGDLIKYKDEAGVPGVGDSIQLSLNASKDMLEQLVQHVTIVTEVVQTITGPLSGKKFCLTGTMSRKRSDIANDIKNKGGEVFDDVSDGVTLVQADVNSVSSKSKKAKKVGSEIISEDDLNKML